MSTLSHSFITLLTSLPLWFNRYHVYGLLQLINDFFNGSTVQSTRKHRLILLVWVMFSAGGGRNNMLKKAVDLYFINHQNPIPSFLPKLISSVLSSCFEVTIVAPLAHTHFYPARTFYRNGQDTYFLTHFHHHQHFYVLLQSFLFLSTLIKLGKVCGPLFLGFRPQPLQPAQLCNPRSRARQVTSWASASYPFTEPVFPNLSEGILARSKQVGRTFLIPKLDPGMEFIPAHS